MRDCSFPSTSRLLGGLAAVLWLGCGGPRMGLPEPTAKHLDYAGRNGQATSLTSLQHGRKLYVNRCSACHALYMPAQFKADEWPALVERMADNAKLNPDQKRDVLGYVSAVAAAAQDTAATRPMGGAAPAPGSTPADQPPSAPADQPPFPPMDQAPSAPMDQVPAAP